MQVRDDDQADRERHLDPEDDLKRRARLPVARRERDTGDARDQQRAVAERPPAQAELLHRPPARLSLECADRRYADEDQRRRAADPDGRGQQVHDDEDGGHAFRIVRTRSRKSGGARRSVVRSSSSKVHQRASATPSAARSIVGCRLVRAHTHEIDVVRLVQQAVGPTETCGNAPRRAGLARTRAGRAPREARGGELPGGPHRLRSRRPASPTTSHPSQGCGTGRA